MIVGEPSTQTFIPALLPVCGALTDLPAALQDAARTQAEGAEPGDVESKLRCVLQAHVAGDHQALVRELADSKDSSLWTAWSDGQDPDELSVRSDCPARRADEACCSFAHHPGSHTYDVTDPWTLPVHQPRFPRP
ncbi:hypothetical protein [Streptomyces sp. NBC_01477]|uniref:hypothetical protein n=1 Tax=Streptomyces sp. NBC_01477 TaxID=2976015 RepID=UPI002E33232E|nr:hypothetical protein [Streptomyces sp. NBC_01477]